MQEFLESFPRPLVIIDGGLQIVACSRRAFPVFGLRGRSRSGDPRARLLAALEAERELGDHLALATARLLKPGDEERFTWQRAERSYAVTVVAREAEDDTFLVFFEDTTRDALSQEILLKARHYLEHILGNIPLGVIVLNCELRITSMNRQEHDFLRRMGMGVTLVEAIGATLEEALPGELGSEWQRLCRAVLESGEKREEARKAYPVEGGALVLSTVVTPLTDNGEEVAGVILVAEDVTEETRLEKELVRAEKLATVGQMVITVNHEINNPLSIISSSAQTARLLHPDLDLKVVDKLRRIEDQVKRIAEVTERLRKMDEVVTDEYIRGGEDMIDLWKGERGA